MGPCLRPGGLNKRFGNLKRVWELKIKARRLKLRVWELKIKARRLKLRVWDRKLKLRVWELKIKARGLN